MYNVERLGKGKQKLITFPIVTVVTDDMAYCFASNAECFGELLSESVMSKADCCAQGSGSSWGVEGKCEQCFITGMYLYIKYEALKPYPLVLLTYKTECNDLTKRFDSGIPKLYIMSHIDSHCVQTSMAC